MSRYIRSGEQRRASKKGAALVRRKLKVHRARARKKVRKTLGNITSINDLKKLWPFAPIAIIVIDYIIKKLKE